MDTFGEYSRIDDVDGVLDQESRASGILAHESNVIFTNGYEFAVDVLWKDPSLPFDQVTTLNSRL